MRWDQELASPRGAGTAGRESLLSGTAECPGRGAGLFQGTRLLCRHSHGTKSGAPWRDDKPEAAAEHGARCGATLPDAPAPPSWCQVLSGSRCTDAPLGLLKQRKGSPVCPGWLVTRGGCCQALWELLRGVGFNPSISEQYSYCWCNSIHIYLYIHIYISAYVYL